ncbi:hypothetical protein ACODT5_03015 [Streptomyces sp. 5.8]|uniref:zinc finger domain-containing protein n=1 Tax=Streptomyces sp. 5.8 TaxID=3406571 RepID=UPI003BB80A08
MTADLARPNAPSGALQPIPAPVYRFEYQQLLAAGVLVDRAGRTVSGAPCPTCDWLMDTFTCPGSLPCPRCSATSGQRCMRPSGHTADRFHTSRVRAAEAVDRDREEADDQTLLAPWPE